MKITIESTEETTELDGVECRLWHGTTAAGVACLVFVHRIAVPDTEDQATFETELQAKPKPADRPGGAVPVVVLVVERDKADN